MTTAAVIAKPDVAADTAGVKAGVVIAKPDAAVDAVGVKAGVKIGGVDDAVAAAVADHDADGADFILEHPVSVNIRPILESVAGLLTAREIDQWFVEMESANEQYGVRLELTGAGELVISPMGYLDSTFAEMEFGTDLNNWCRDYGGRTTSPSGIVSLPDGTRAYPDAAWLSPAQLEELGPLRPSRAINICPVFVAEIMSFSDRLPPMQRKMERYLANGAKLGWLIDPYHRRVYIYRPGVPIEVLDDPETISGDPILPGFVFAVRQRIFALHD